VPQPAEAGSHWVRRCLLYGALVVALGYTAAMAYATSGHAVPQIVDLYLICQYGRALAEGHPFRYNPGEPPSTGATSLLLTGLFGLAHASGLRGERLIAFAIAVGAAAYVATVQLAHRLAARLAGPREAALAGALVLLGGPTVWGFLYGSDIGLFMLLFTWLTERLFAGSAAGVALAGTLLALARPEGLPIALVVALAGPWLWLSDRRGRVLCWLPVAAGGAVLCLYHALTGYWVSSSVADKSLLASYDVLDSLRFTTEYVIDTLRGLLLGFYPSTAPIGFSQGFAPFFFPPLALLLVIVAAAHADAARPAATRTWSVAAAAVFLLVAPNTFMGVHFNRYVMWAFPTLLTFTAVGLGRVAALAAPADAALERRIFRGTAGLFMVLGALSTAHFAAIYGDMAGEVYRRDVAAADWIIRTLPPGVAMANLATSVEYLTGHRNVNLHGVTTPAFFGTRTAEREAGTFEAMGRLPAADRPPYLITTVSTHDSLAAMKELVAGPPLFRTLTFGDEIEIFRMDYSLVDRNRRPLAAASGVQIGGRHLVDELNVCDALAERSHRYESTSVTGIRLNGVVRVAEYREPGAAAVRVIDAGRAIVGREAFDIAAHRGADVVVVMRTAPQMSVNVLRAAGSGVFDVDFTHSTLQVTADGHALPRLTFQPDQGWFEQVFTIPGSALGEDTTRLELRGQFASFYYWFYQ
jgi:hypothetical protein